MVAMNASRLDAIWQQDAVAGWYRDHVRGAVPFAGEQLAVMLRFIAAANQPIRRVLDVGAGDGLLSAAVLSQHPQAQPVLADFSPSMLEAAAGRLAPLTDAARLVAADLATPAWREQITPLAPFEAAVSGLAIHHLPDERKRALYGELFALLAPGGAFVHIEHVAPEADWIRAAFEAGMIDGLVDFSQRQGSTASRDEIATAYYQRPDRVANILAPLDSQLAWLREIGFVDVVAPFRWYELAVFGGYRPLT
jgi:ubiquinone/menaquinone biosynthesis C-methylase UbiE